jgi:prolyl oligopeptidase
MPEHQPPHRHAVEETIGGISFEDPYTWLEEDSLESLSWQSDQTSRAVAYLEKIPGFDDLRAAAAGHIEQMNAFAPLHRGPYWFRMGIGDSGVTIEVADGPVTPGRVLIDPTTLSPEESRPASLDWFYPSPNGCHVAFGLSFGGDEQSVLHVIETSTGVVLPDRIAFCSIATVAWLPDGDGFYYNAGHAPDWIDADKQIFLHRLGDTRQATAEPLSVREAYCVFPQISPNGRWLAAVTSEMDPRADFVKELPVGEWRPFLLELDGRGYGVFVGDAYVAITTDGAPRGRLVSIPVATSADRDTWTEILPEGKGVIVSVELVGDHLVVCELVNSYARLKILGLDGSLEDEPELPGDGSVLQYPGLGHYLTASPWMGMNVSPGEDEFTFAFSTFTRSPALYCYHLRDRSLEQLTDPVTAHPHLVVTEDTAIASDGTTVHYQVIRRDDVDASTPQPTLIYGYGGWNISFLPGYLGVFLPFVEAGGTFVFAHLRGGGEFGAEFWRDGRLERKQHTYDDLYAIAEHLLATATTTQAQLGVVGMSNGGLLTGVAATQRPELWRVVCSMVPLYDMLKFTRDSYTATCTLEYGDPANPAEARTMYAYSPYHNVRDGQDYPAVLIYCGNNDMRCRPWQSRKLAARLQAGNTSELPILLRVVDEGGHITIMSVPSQVAEWLGFLMYELGLRPIAPPQTVIT